MLLCMFGNKPVVSVGAQRPPAGLLGSSSSNRTVLRKAVQFALQQTKTPTMHR